MQILHNKEIKNGKEYEKNHTFYDLFGSGRRIVLDISDVKIESNSLYVTCTGKITNNGKNTYKYVRVKGAFRNAAGTTVDTSSGYAVGSEGLAPNESSSFTLSVKKDSSIKSCYVSLTDYKVE